MPASWQARRRPARDPKNPALLMRRPAKLQGKAFENPCFEGVILRPCSHRRASMQAPFPFHQPYNCTSAGTHNDSAEVALPTTDLVVRENYFYNVKYGINLSATGGALGRVVIENNVIELTQSVTGPTGLSLLSSAGSSPVFNQVVARGNCIRPADGVSPSASTVGITLSRISQAVIESNVISVSDANQAVTHANCGSVKCFDNQSPQGVILRGYDSTSTVHDAELTTDVEDALLNL